MIPSDYKGQAALRIRKSKCKQGINRIKEYLHIHIRNFLSTI